MGWSELQKVSVKKYDLGTGKTFDIKTLLPNIDYTKLTADDFIVGIISADAINTTQSGVSVSSKASANGFELAYSYDTSTGILTITSGYRQGIYVKRASDGTTQQGVWQTNVVKAWLVY